MGKIAQSVVAIARCPSGPLNESIYVDTTKWIAPFAKAAGVTETAAIAEPAAENAR